MSSPNVRVGSGTVSELVRAAGGVVLRRNGDRREVALVHRPKYEDWTLPKGKLEPGETDEQAAVREVEEETGMRCELDEELPLVRYRDAQGRDKLVRYWRMHVVGGSFSPTAEIDELRWLEIEDGATLLSYERDRAVLRSAVETLSRGTEPAI
jgi:8-oxo-dGTP pyrophosphatase MutT (NUDIX family)